MIDYATRECTRSMYAAHATVVQRNLHGFEYRKAKSKFKDEVFKAMNDALDTYKFDIRTSPKANVETDVIITEGDIPVDSKGITEKIGISIEAHDDRESVVRYEDDPGVVLALYKDTQTVKLFYKEHHKYACYSQNWGASKGVDRYQDVCVVLNRVG